MIICWTVAVPRVPNGYSIRMAIPVIAAAGEDQGGPVVVTIATNSYLCTDAVIMVCTFFLMILIFM